MKSFFVFFMSCFYIANSQAACPTAALLKGYYSGINTTVLLSNNVEIYHDKTLIRIYIDGKGTDKVWGAMTLISIIKKNTSSASYSTDTSQISAVKYQYNPSSCLITQKLLLTNSNTVYYTFVVTNGGFKLYGINNDQVASVTSPTFYVESMDWWKE